jgi:thiol:disulfide interchange protein DsbD
VLEPVKVPRLEDKGLLLFILTAIGAGIVALLTPCVFPMVPITVSFFLKQNEAKGSRPIVLAFVFSLSIVAAFVVIGVGIAAIFGATKPNELANNWILNLFLAGIFFAFALNMLGLFEIQVPSWLLSMTSSGEQTGGFVGVIFMALTFVLTSFSCTFAFVGSLLATAAKGQYYWPILGMLAFGATFAAPFFALALMPGFLKKLPKSGGWLNSVKVVMGFVEAGVAVKYISIVDQQWNAVPWLFDFTNVMTLWAVLSLCTGIYLLGQFRLSHDSPVQGLSPMRVMFAMGFLILGGLFVVGLTTPDRDSWVLDQLVAFAPARLDNEDFELDLDRGIQDAVKANKPLFIDFTGVNCVNCRLMEKRMAKRHNHRRLERCVLVQLYTDKVPKVAADEAKRILAKNVALQKGWFGDVTLPAYVVATPDGKTILSSYLGLESRTGEFAKFLDEGWDKWQTMQGNKISKVDHEPAR